MSQLALRKLVELSQRVESLMVAVDALTQAAKHPAAFDELTSDADAQTLLESLESELLRAADSLGDLQRGMSGG